MMSQQDQNGFSMSLTVGQPNGEAGPSVDFAVRVMEVLGRKYGNRLITQAAFDSWLVPLGKIESEYRRLDTSPPRQGKTGKNRKDRQ